jgi:hypothetical protein
LLLNTVFEAFQAADAVVPELLVHCHDDTLLLVTVAALAWVQLLRTVAASWHYSRWQLLT